MLPGDRYEAEVRRRPVAHGAQLARQLRTGLEEDETAWRNGQWHTARIEQSANADGSQTIRAYGDGQLLASVRDRRHLNGSGHLLLYNEGSVAEFDYVRAKRGK